MKKQEYIEKYGEEAWKARLEYNREWIKQNSDRKKENDKKYYELHKEKYLKKASEWAKANPEKRKVSRKKWENSNPSKILEKTKLWQAKNKEHISDYRLKHRQTKEGRATYCSSNYKEYDKKSGFDTSNNISSKWIVDNIFSGQKCVYCGDQDWTHLGCDRIDNSKPHTEDNVVCSCGLCNIERADKYTVEEFKKYRSLHPRECDIPKAPAIQLSETGALKKRVIQKR